MKKQIILISSSLLIASVIFISLFTFVKMVVQDHRNINAVTNYLNAVIDAQNKAAQAQPTQ